MASKTSDIGKVDVAKIRPWKLASDVITFDPTTAQKIWGEPPKWGAASFRGFFLGSLRESSYRPLKFDPVKPLVWCSLYDFWPKRARKLARRFTWNFNVGLTCKKVTIFSRFIHIRGGRNFCGYLKKEKAAGPIGARLLKRQVCHLARLDHTNVARLRALIYDANKSTPYWRSTCLPDKRWFEWECQSPLS